MTVNNAHLPSPLIEHKFLFDYRFQANFEDLAELFLLGRLASSHQLVNQILAIVWIYDMLLELFLYLWFSLIFTNLTEWISFEKVNLVTKSDVHVDARLWVEPEIYAVFVKVGLPEWLYYLSTHAVNLPFAAILAWVVLFLVVKCLYDARFSRVK